MFEFRGTMDTAAFRQIVSAHRATVFATMRSSASRSTELDASLARARAVLYEARGKRIARMLSGDQDHGSAIVPLLHRSGRAERSFQLWNVLNLSAWFDYWIAGKEPARA